MLFSPLSGYPEGVIDREVEKEVAVGRISGKYLVPRDSQRCGGCQERRSGVLFRRVAVSAGSCFGRLRRVSERISA